MDWRLITEEQLSGPRAMAFDEIAAETVRAGGPATVRLYRWTPSTVSLGYGNDADVIDWKYCTENAVDVTRRQTGGGAIYHDTAGDVAYSIIAPKSAFFGDVTESYRELLEPVLAAFDSVGAAVDFADSDAPDIWKPMCYLRALDPAHDLVGPDGGKIAGNAQYRTRDAIIQHGSLTFSSDPECRLTPFVDPPISTSTFANRVCGLADIVAGLDRSTFVDRLETELAEWADADPGTWTDGERERATKLCETKYDNEQWVRDRIDPTE